jgi:ubiquinone/menaquinone biosynthesis C-methylase UbiE
MTLPNTANTTLNTPSLNWSQIDREQPQSFIDYLDTATAQTEIQRYKQKTYTLLGTTPGAVLLDVGCGIGEDALALAQHVGASGKVVGLDCSASLIEEARRRVRSQNLSLTFQVGNVYHLEFPDNCFDGCRADRLFMHLENPQQALREMMRVTRPGGRMVVREPDWDTLVVDHPDPRLTQQILNSHFGQAIRHPTVGRTLYRLFRQVGLEQVTVADTSTLVLTDFSTANHLYGFADAATHARARLPELSSQIATWLMELEQADRDNLFFSAVTGFTVIGYKPSET